MSVLTLSKYSYARKHVVDVTKHQLYEDGIVLAKRFCAVNGIKPPKFFTYLDAAASRVREHTKNSPVVGALTGLYVNGTVYVNVGVTAMPVLRPAVRSWSWPRWKTDRTAMGVVAHELGHYVWRTVHKRWNQMYIDWMKLAAHTKKISSYEPVPEEAWAETMRLFILNPTLLRLAIPQRYYFIVEECNLAPSEKRGWKQVLRNQNYFSAAERWIAK